MCVNLLECVIEMKKLIKIWKGESWKVNPKVSVYYHKPSLNTLILSTCPSSAKPGLILGVCVCVSLLILLCVCDAGDGSLALADIADARPLTLHRLLPQSHLQPHTHTHTRLVGAQVYQLNPSDP